MKALLEKNSVCADCSATSPDWVSLNLGAIVCLNCSGVHRSLGTHISKVRSLTLDQLSEPSMRSLERMGTAAVNRIYEADPRYKYDKPRGSQIERKERDAYIRKKYADRTFLGPCSISPPQRLTELHKSVADNTLERVAWCIAHGADVNIKYRGKTSLHVAAAHGYADIVEFLYQNGASVDATDDKGIPLSQSHLNAATVAL